MNDARFDEIARGLDARLTRRHAGGLATAALLAMGLTVESDAKKKKKKKKTFCLNGQTTVVKGPKKKLKKKAKKLRKQGATPGACSPPAVTDTCSNLNEACGGTSSCECLLDTNNNKVCLGRPGLSTRKCQSNAGCQAGEFCEKEFEICLPDCSA